MKVAGTLVQALVNHLVGASSVDQTAAKVVLHCEPLAPVDIWGEPTTEVALPTSTKDGISVAGLAELELDDPIEHRSAILGRCLVAATAGRHEDRDGDERDGETPTHTIHRKNWTRIGGDRAATG